MGIPAHGYRLRIGRFSESGRGYLLTTVTAQRKPLFLDFTLARLAIGELRACDQAGLCETIAFVLMPDHMHWMVQLKKGGAFTAVSLTRPSVADVSVGLAAPICAGIEVHESACG